MGRDLPFLVLHPNSRSDRVRVYVLHENDDWLGPFAEAFDAAGVPWEPWFLDGGAIDLSEPPPEGVFWSRMSASSHTRGHLRSKPHTRSVLSWLEAHGRRVVNGRSVLELEMSKVDQYTALASLGIEVPQTIAVIGEDRELARRQARSLPAPFITKDNQGGKGVGVRRFDTYEAFDCYLDSDEFERPIDDTLLLQEFVASAEPFITRVEIVGGEFLYALTADTSQGFELCPADACRIDELACPADGTTDSLFAWRWEFTEADAAPWVEVAHRLGIEIAGFEFIETTDGRRVTYDINTNTNYSPDVEQQAPRSGPAAIAGYLGRLLAAEQRPAA